VNLKQLFGESFSQTDNISRGKSTESGRWNSINDSVASWPAGNRRAQPRRPLSATDRLLDVYM